MTGSSSDSDDEHRKKRKRRKTTVSQRAKQLPKALLKSTESELPWQPSRLELIPFELHREISSHWPEVPWPIDLIYDNPGLQYKARVPRERVERSQALWGLSQTCRKLREIYLPVLWRIVEACPLTSARERLRRAKFTSVLLRRTRCLLQSPDIAPHVRCMIVSFEECNSRDNWKPLCQFIQSLRFLPNIDKVHITRCDLSLQPLIQAAAEDDTFSTITELILPCSAWPLVRSCPELRSVTVVSRKSSYRPDCDSELLLALKGLKHIERLAYFSTTKAVMENISKIAPNLLSIEFDSPAVSPPLLRYLLSLKHLHSIELRARGDIAKPLEPEEQDSIRAAKEILRASPTVHEKILAMRHQRVDQTPTLEGYVHPNLQRPRWPLDMRDEDIRRIAIVWYLWLWVPYSMMIHAKR
ncbi:hypothetical protein C8J56DRAFT_856192 [Mycena floridula]|nr:hypothetical protein C8J56DRAFT_856192 [Mycena floridula]